MIQVKNLSISFGQRVLFSSVSFTIGNGLFQLKGDSGKGKTTLRNILRKQQAQDFGEVLYSERDPIFSYCGPKSTLLSDYSLEKNLKILKKPYNEKRFSELKKGLRFHYLDKPLLQLSGGERRKAELLLCLSYEADYYFLDEPFASLDIKSKEYLTKFLNEFAEDHSIILISHDVNPDLILSGSIDLNNVEKEKKEQTKTICRRKGTFRLLPAFLSDRKNNRLSNFICMLLGLLSFVAFAFGVAFTQTKTDSQEARIARKADPFSAHYLNPNHVDSLPSEQEFYSVIYNQGRTKLTLGRINGGGRLSLFGCLNEGEAFCFYSQGEENPMISQEQTLSAYGKSYSVKVMQRENLSSLSLPDSLERRELQDGKKEGQYLFCSKSFVEQVIVHLGEEIEFSSDSISLYPLSSVGYNTYSDLLTRTDKEKTTCIIEDTEEPLLAVPGKRKGDQVSLSDKSKCYVTAECNDGRVHLSTTRYKLFSRIHDAYQEGDISLLIQDKDFASLAKYSKELKGEDLIFNANFDFYPILCYIISGSFILGELIYCQVSYSGRKRWCGSLSHLYQNHNFSSLSMRLGILFSKVVNFLPNLILSFILYFVLCLPVANYKGRIMVYSYRQPGFYYYSKEPRNNYYDSLTHPVSFETYLPYIFFLFILFALLLLIQWLFLAVPAKEKAKKK